jgi:hypothetical protein
LRCGEAAWRPRFLQPLERSADAGLLPVELPRRRADSPARTISTKVRIRFQSTRLANFLSLIGIGVLVSGQTGGNSRKFPGMHWGIERIYAIHKILASGVMGVLL